MSFAQDVVRHILFRINKKTIVKTAAVWYTVLKILKTLFAQGVCTNMASTTYKTHGVCSRSIYIETDGDTITDVRFEGGCSGNTQGVASLVKGMKIKTAIERLSGIKCGFKNTSCPDQLSKALTGLLEGSAPVNS